MGKIIGIDLGTTNSVVAIMEGKEPKVIANEEGARLTPSVVAWDDKGEVLVGQIARRQAITNPENTVYSVKRFMGRKFDEVQRRGQARPLQGRARAERRRRRSRSAARRYSPPEVSARVLLKLKQRRRGLPRREGHRGGHHRPGVLQRRPAPGDQGRRPHRRPRRQAHRQRADRGRARLRPRQEEGRAHRRLRLRRRHLRHLDPRGRREGRRGRLDQRRHAPRRRRHRQPRHGLADRRVQEGPGHRRLARTRWSSSASRRRRRRPRSSCRACRRRRSTCRSSPPTRAGPKHLQMKLSRAKLEQMMGDLVERTIEPAKKALADAGKKPADIDEVVLVGGSTRIPMVQKTVKEFFGKEPHKGVNPDEVVALGAAVQARRALGRRQGHAAPRRHAAVARHRDARRRDDDADPAQHDHPDQEDARRSRRRPTTRRSVEVHVHAGRAPDGARQPPARQVPPRRASRRRRAACRRSRSPSTSTPTAS